MAAIATIRGLKNLVAIMVGGLDENERDAGTDMDAVDDARC
jgi:hypothetical protein